MEAINVTRDADRFTANAYVVPGERPTLVDAGAMPGVVEAIAEHVPTLDAVVITHRHADHVGKLASVIEAYEPAVYMYASHELRTNPLEDGDRVTIGDGSYEVLHTPGHADDHVVLIGETALFSGDVVVYNDGAFDDGSFGKTDGPNMSREVLIDSIERLLAALPASVEAMYPGHGDTYTGDIHAVIERALERAKRREPKYPE